MKTIKNQRLATGLMAAVLMACTAWAAKASRKEFKPGEIWTDTSGVPINAHGGGVLYHNKVYYWYGEIKTGKTWLPECNRSWGGTRVETVRVSCYWSQDLYNWKCRENVLPAGTCSPRLWSGSADQSSANLTGGSALSNCQLPVATSLILA